MNPKQNTTWHMVEKPLLVSTVVRCFLWMVCSDLRRGFLITEEENALKSKYRGRPSGRLELCFLREGISCFTQVDADPTESTYFSAQIQSCIELEI